MPDYYNSRIKIEKIVAKHFPNMQLKWGAQDAERRQDNIFKGFKPVMLDEKTAEKEGIELAAGGTIRSGSGTLLMRPISMEKEHRANIRQTVRQNLSMDDKEFEKFRKSERMDLPKEIQEQLDTFNKANAG